MKTQTEQPIPTVTVAESIKRMSEADRKWMEENGYLRTTKEKK